MLQPGSLWRKWDLHIHTPHSVFNNQFPKLPTGVPNWEAYVSALEKIEDIAVLGITDYFSIDGYKELKKFRNSGRLKNFEMILPNIEFRLDLLIPVASDPNSPKSKKINAHILFDESVSTDDIEDRFLRELKFVGRGHPQDTSEPCSLSKHQLEQLGKRLKAEQPTFTGSDYHVGCLNASVSFELIKKVLHDNRSVFEGKHMLLIAAENLSEIPWKGQGHQQRKVVIQGSDGIFAGQPNDRLWALGKRQSSPDEFVAEFGCLKPCLHGSDAHAIETLGKPEKERFCWIKADPTFEGLRQVLFEPEDRVFIGDAPPDTKQPFRVIQDITVEGAPSWFNSKPIPINRGLLSVIGGRGTGKSALAELLAYSGGSTFFSERKKSDLNDSFLYKASRRSASNLAPLTGAQITLGWSDGTADIVKINGSLQHGLEEEKVKYLPQKFVEKLCSPESTGDLLREIENVIFSRIPTDKRLNSSEFSSLRESMTGAIRVRRQYLTETIFNLNKEIAVLFDKVGEREAKRASLKEYEHELGELAKNKPDISSASDDDIEKLAAAQANLRSLQDRIANLSGTVQVVGEIEAKMIAMKQRVNAFNADIRNQLLQAGIDDIANFELVFPASYPSILKARKDALVANVEELKKAPGELGTEATLVTIEQLRKKLALSDSKRIAFEKFEKQRIETERQIKLLNAEINSIDKIEEGTLKEKRAERLEKLLDYFELLSEEKTVLDELYRPFQEALDRAGGIGKKLNFSSKVTMDISAHAQRGSDLFDSRKRGRFRDADVLQAELKRVMDDLDAAGFVRDQIKERILAFREEFFVDANGEQINMPDLLRGKQTIEDFNNWFFDLSPYQVIYAINFEGKDLSLLSPGQKGIVLLVVYLGMDEDDQRPLIIDQPEDNLDNLSVYSTLIAFFRTRKQHRQIVLVTHNPNLVVNSDSEQIAVADFDGSRSPRIRYSSGAIENTGTSGIREQACEILEGGPEAFQRREQKYALQ
jgi:hypothetical protein